MLPSDSQAHSRSGHEWACWAVCAVLTHTEELHSAPALRLRLPGLVSLVATGVLCVSAHTCVFCLTGVRQRTVNPAGRFQVVRTLVLLKICLMNTKKYCYREKMCSMRASGEQVLIYTLTIELGGTRGDLQSRRSEAAPPSFPLLGSSQVADKVHPQLQRARQPGFNGC